MIFDNLNNAKQYYNLSDGLKEGFEFLLDSDLKNMADGKHIIDGDKIYANIQTLETKPIEKAAWEVHRKYIDIQYVIKGSEKMGFGLLNDFDKTIKPYDDEKDVAFLEGKNKNYLDVKRGYFTVFFPNDVHAPMLSVDNSQEIKKVIVKIKL